MTCKRHNHLFGDVFGPDGLMHQVFGSDGVSLNPSEPQSDMFTTRFGSHRVDYGKEQMTYVATVPGAIKKGSKIEVVAGSLQIEVPVRGDGKLIPEEDTFVAEARLPDIYDPTKANATIANGIVRVVIPAKESATPESVKIL